MLFDPSSSTQIYTLPVMFQKRSETMFIFWRLTRRSLCSLTRLPSKTDLGCSKTWRGVVCLVEPRALSGTAAISSGGCVVAWSAMQTSLMEYEGTSPTTTSLRFTLVQPLASLTPFLLLFHHQHPVWSLHLCHDIVTKNTARVCDIQRYTILTGDCILSNKVTPCNNRHSGCVGVGMIEATFSLLPIRAPSKWFWSWCLR